MENKPFSDDEKELAFDLRQAWVKIVAQQLEEIKEGKKTGVLSKYFSEIEDVYDLIIPRCKKPETREKEINPLLTKVAELANNNKQLWIGKIENNNKYSEIYNNIRKIERLLYKIMEEENMFGGYYDDEGL